VGGSLHRRSTEGGELVGGTLVGLVNWLNEPLVEEPGKPELVMGLKSSKLKG